MAKFRIRGKRSCSRAKEMLVAQVRYGQGQAGAGQRYDLDTEEGVKQFLADLGHPDFDRLVEELRPKDAVLPFETHLFTAGWNMGVPPGGYAALRQGDREVARIEGESGRLVETQYQERFNHSVRNLNRCTDGEEADYGDLLACFSSGLASIEGFINYRAEPERHRLARSDKPDRNISVDFKLDNWIPALSAGNPINKGEKYWQDYKEVRRIRNECESHPKAKGYGISGTPFCKQLNQWRTGIAMMLLALDVMTGRLAPPELIKHAFLPDIELVRD